MNEYRLSSRIVSLTEPVIVKALKVSITKSRFSMHILTYSRIDLATILR